MKWAHILTVVFVLHVAAYGTKGTAQSPTDEKFNSANRLMFWVNAQRVATLTDAELNLWKGRGVGGFICMTGRFPQMGGVTRFTGDGNANLSAKGLELQRTFHDSRIVQRATERDMKMYLGCKLVNYFNTSTPLKDWFDDEGWNTIVRSGVRDLAGAAKLLRFDGIAIDQELYPQTGKVTTATWDWDYPGNTHSEAEVRAQASQRGRELMHAILEGFPEVEIVVYHYCFPETWNDVVQKRVNKIDHPADKLLFLDFWDGASSIEGYRAIRFINALFYKTPHSGTWDAAFQYEYNGFYSLLSRRLSNWPYASSRIFQSPFIWINAGPKPGYQSARPPQYVATQLEAFSKWGMGGEFANFCYGGLDSFDYTPYVSAIQTVAKPFVADAEPPHLQFTPPARAISCETQEPTLDLEGIATDNLAIRAIRWQNDRGGSGTAKMTWQIKSGNEKVGYDGQMNWSISGIALRPGMNRIVVTVEDIKGLTISETLSVNGK